jgi:hypothetical protein
MKEGGFGGFEIQPVYPLELDDPEKGVRNLPYLSPEFLDDLRYVNKEGNELGLRASLTLSSGWPYGGPNTPITEAAGALREVTQTVGHDQRSAPLPPIGNGEKLLAAFLDHKSGSGTAEMLMLPLPAEGVKRIEIPEAQEGATLRFYVSSRTGQQVKRPAVDADGFVLDHFSREAVRDHLSNVASKLIAAFGDEPPYSVFSDSLEVYSSDWTPTFLQEFRARRGYDLLPHLPELFSKNPGQDALSVRHDWGLTLTDLVDDNYLSQVGAWAKDHHTRLRAQVYGPPAVSLSSNALVDLPEGEGPQWRQFSFTRWATSASHVYGKPVTSSETWTWLHSPAFNATPLDMKAEADRFFLQGVNQLVGHGWPYSPTSAGEPGWRFYAAAVFNAHNPWWIVMPDVARYMQRVSWILRQGEPANQVAIYLPEDDAWSAFTPGQVALTEVMPKWITPALTQAIENAGYNFDYIDAKAIAVRGVHYPVLVMPNVDRIAPETLEQINRYQQQGGKVIAVGSIPAHGTGLMHFDADSQQIALTVKSLFDPAKKGGRLVSSPTELGSALRDAAEPEMQLTPATPDIGMIRRTLSDADVIYVVNTSNEAIHTQARFRSRFHSGLWLDPDTGEIRPAPEEDGAFSLDFVPYESRILLLSAESGESKQQKPVHQSTMSDISTDWEVQFGGQTAPEHMGTLRSWTDAQNTLYFSGVAVYSRDFNLAHQAANGERILLNFGEGTARPDDIGKADHPGMRASYDAPIRDAAIVSINGKRVGTLWHPPYELDITRFLKQGTNHIEIRVANTAINEMAGQSLPDYRLLWARYGQRFVPQDMENLKPLPSGILGKVTLDLSGQ